MMVQDRIPVRTGMAKDYLRWNFRIIVGLVVVAMISHVASQSSENGALLFLLERLNHDVEVSIPTLYNYLLILVNVGLASWVYLSMRRSQAPHAGYWLFFAIVLFFMGYDEAAGVHEALMAPMRSIVPNSPLLNFPWTPVGALVALVVAAIFVPFLRRLPRRVAVLMMAAGAIYLFGALVVETIGGWFSYYQERDWRYAFIAATEESFEMLGMVVLTCAFLEHIEARRAGVQEVGVLPQ